METIRDELEFRLTLYAAETTRDVFELGLDKVFLKIQVWEGI